MNRPSRAIVMRLLAVACSLASVSAYADEKPTYTPATDVRDGEALVYVYRRFKLAGSAAPMGFSLNGEPVAALWAGRYTVLAVPAGHVTLWSLPVGTERVRCQQVVGNWFVSYFHEGIPYIENRAYKRPIEFDAAAGAVYYVELQLGFRSRVQPEVEAMPDLVKAKFVDPRSEVLAGTLHDAETMKLEVEAACRSGATLESVAAAARLTASRVPAR